MASEKHPIPSPEQSTDYFTRSLKGLSVLMGGLSVYLVGVEVVGPESIVEAELTAAAGLAILGAGAFVVIDSAFAHKDSSRQ